MSPRTQPARQEKIPVHQHRPRQAHYVTGSPLRTLIFGTIGSLLIMVASFGVGWLADASPFRQVSWIIPLRYTATGLISCITLLVIGSMMLCREWLRMVQKLIVWDQRAARWASITALCWITPSSLPSPSTAGTSSPTSPKAGSWPQGSIPTTTGYPQSITSSNTGQIPSGLNQRPPMGRSSC